MKILVICVIQNLENLFTNDKKLYTIKTKYNFKNVFEKHFDESLEKLHKKFKFERRFSNMAVNGRVFSRC